jgi:hypothetical protein
MSQIFEVSAYYLQPAFCEVRFHLRAEREAAAYAVLRCRMREQYPAEVSDGAFVPGFAWPVPGVPSEARLYPPSIASRTRWKRRQ